MMKRIYFVFFCLHFFTSVNAQTVTPKVAAAYSLFENDAQLKNAIASLYIIDGKTGKVVFDKNSGIGLAPASTQKIITSVTAYAVLGKDFRYETNFGYTGKIENGNLNGSIYIKPSGDPTFGSWRWEGTKETEVIRRLVEAIKKLNFKNYNGLVVDGAGWEGETIPDGWIWQDIGNYYGAGAEALNWRENQYDLILKSGSNLKDPVEVVGTNPVLYSYSFTSFATSAAKGTGDNAYIYFPLNSSQGIVRGTIPVNENRFIISGAMPSARNQFVSTLSDAFLKAGIQNKLTVTTTGNNPSEKVVFFHTETSPSLDSIIYWFNKKSINLYGEALVKTMGLEKNKTATTEKGVEVIKNTWKSNGIPSTELNIVDGSGLSPLNRTTTNAQVKILQHAKSQSWFSGFYHSLPEYNGMKMKSGTIKGVKGFTGYHTSKSGNEYIFSFIVNNYNGSASSLVQKMYKVLDELK